MVSVAGTCVLLHKTAVSEISVYCTAVSALQLIMHSFRSAKPQPVRYKLIYNSSWAVQRHGQCHNLYIALL